MSTDRTVARTSARPPRARGASATARRSRGSTRRRPRRATSSSSRPRYGLFINGREVAPRPAARRSRHRPGHRAAARPDREGDRRRTSTRRSRRRRAGVQRRWGSLPGRERAKYLFRIARILQERSREFAVLESMDSGKPIKESRATSTCRSPRRTSGTTRAGRTSSSTRSRAATRSRSASPPRSSRGTSRC